MGVDKTQIYYRLSFARKLAFPNVCRHRFSICRHFPVLIFCFTFQTSFTLDIRLVHCINLPTVWRCLSFWPKKVSFGSYGFPLTGISRPAKKSYQGRGFGGTPTCTTSTHWALTTSFDVPRGIATQRTNDQCPYYDVQLCIQNVSNWLRRVGLIFMCVSCEAPDFVARMFHRFGKSFVKCAFENATCCLLPPPTPGWRKGHAISPSTSVLCIFLHRVPVSARFSLHCPDPDRLRTFSSSPSMGAQCTTFRTMAFVSRLRTCPSYFHRDSFNKVSNRGTLILSFTL